MAKIVFKMWLAINSQESRSSSSYLFSTFDFSLSSHALISDIFFSVSTLASTASDHEEEDDKINMLIEPNNTINVHKNY